MIRVIFNAFFTEIHSNKKTFVCLKFSQIFKHNIFTYILLLVYFILFFNIDIFKFPYIFSSIETFFLFGLWILITYHAFFPILIFWTFVDKSKIELDISILSSNIKLIAIYFMCYLVVLLYLLSLNLLIFHI